MSKKIAFFGDSFVGECHGWIEVFCEQNNYECVHVGKYGADQIYPFIQWKRFNEEYKEKVDICVYSHTDGHRLFNAHPEIRINTALLYDAKDTLQKWINSGLISNNYISAAKGYFEYLQDFSEVAARNLIIPMGIDRYINDNNKIFDKVIHMWSFAPSRFREAGVDTHTWKANPIWHFDIISGINIILDLTNLSASEPQFKLTNGFCDRPLHFSEENSWFMCDILNTAIKYHEKGSSIDFRPYDNADSIWDDYLSAFSQIKSLLESKHEKNK